MVFLGLRWGWLLVVPLTGILFVAGLDDGAGGGLLVAVLSALIVAFVVVRASGAVVSRVWRTASGIVGDGGQDKTD